MIRLPCKLLSGLFEEKHIVFALRQGDAPEAMLALPENLRVEPFSMFISNGNLWSAGAFSYSQSALPPETVVGRYCSIAPAVSVFHSEHPLSFISTSPFSYRPEAAPIFEQAIALSPHAGDYRAIRHDDCEQSPIRIGNDVWIGQNVLLKKGIRIHDGAVIAAGSVVTRDVQGFSVVGGVPAKPLKWRFSEKIRDKARALRWWRYRFTDFQGLDCGDPARFLDGLEKLLDQGGISPFEPEPLTLFSIKEHLERAIGKEKVRGKC
ncbi:MAG: CatB-related O-acetyltransferase [Deltaproteobacteria bacterium]|nr:CatB-related O-acetyltransferase [Deltaproteobacteria bacterium]